MENEQTRYLDWVMGLGRMYSRLSDIAVELKRRAEKAEANLTLVNKFYLELELKREVLYDLALEMYTANAYLNNELDTLYRLFPQLKHRDEMEAIVRCQCVICRKTRREIE